MERELIQYTSTVGWTSILPTYLDSENTLILLFSSPIYKDKPILFKELSEKFPNSKIIGCSSAGEIFGSRIMDESISGIVIKFAKTQVQVFKKEILHIEDSYKTGQSILNELAKENLKAIFVLSDGLKINGSELVKGLNSGKAEEVVITGGLAGDGSEFKQTWEVYNGEILYNHVVAVGLAGTNIMIGHGSRGGWDIFGPERRITRSVNNILYELDGKEALRIYKEYLGDRAAGLPATGLLYPLAIRKDSNDQKQLVRTILGVDEKDQSLTFAGDIPTGYLAQLMRANFDRLISAADEAGSLASVNLLGEADHNPIVSLAVSCVGRRLLLGERSEEETESCLSSLPTNTQQIGFYSYGEISPFTKGTCELHNQTMTLTTLCEVG